MRLTNTTGRACTLLGFPGVSIVGSGNGTQIGAAAAREPGVSAAEVSVSAGGATTFVLFVVNAGNYPPDACQPRPGDGFRIYPPGMTDALFLASTGLTGCANGSVALLRVRPVGTALD